MVGTRRVAILREGKTLLRINYELAFTVMGAQKGMINVGTLCIRENGVIGAANG